MKNEIKIQITVSKTGDSTIRVVQGPGGKECLEATKSLEEAMGTVKERTFTSEYTKTKKRPVVRKIQRGK